MEPIKDLLRTLSSSSQIPVATFCSEACLVICYHMGLLSFFKSVFIFSCVYVLCVSVGECAMFLGA